MPVKSIEEFSGELSPAGSETKSPIPAAHPAGEAEHGGPIRRGFSRRSVVATIMAAFAPVAGTAVAIAAPPRPPAVVIPPAPSESPELLALGAEVETKLSSYRAAAAQLAEARATAAALWPVAPTEIVVDRRDRYARDLFADCYERETDFEGEQVWPDPFTKDGKEFQMPPRDLLRSDALAQFLAEVRAEPDDWDDDGLADDLAGRVRAAEAYEAACAHAIETSDIEEAKWKARRGASELLDLLREIRNHVPRTIAGVLIVARAVTAFGEAQKDSYWPSDHIHMGGSILGATLADAVLRVANINA